MQNIYETTAQRAIRYLEEIQERAVAPTAQAIDELKRFDEPLPEAPTQAADVLAMLDDFGSPATMASAGRRFFGLVIGGSLPVSLAANWLAGAWDQNAVFYRISPVAAALEQVSRKWLVDVLRLPPQTEAAFVTGATMANFTALAAARHKLLTRAGWNVEAQGLFGAPPLTVVVGEEVHPTLIKALGLLGMGRERVLRVPVDGQGRMRADSLPALTENTIVCLQAGNVNTGAFDPFTEICTRAHENRAWVHVDGAFGLWAAAAPHRAHLCEGMQLADSWATDAHKWLNVPYDSGLAFVRDAHALRAAMSVSAAYLPTQTEQRNPADHTPELSRRGRGVEIWAALRGLGRSGVIDLIERTCRHAQRFAEGLAANSYTILNDVVLNQVLVSFGDPQTTNRVIQEIQTDGTCWCGGTIWQGHTAMRISVSSWATTAEDVECCLERMLALAAKVRSSQTER